MGNSHSSSSLNIFNKTKKLSLIEFQNIIPRKMTIHLLSDESKKDCIDFIELFTNEKIGNTEVLLEENIKKKINLYSFMNYKIHKSVSILIDTIEEKVQKVYDNSQNLMFSEVLIILDNSEIENQINEIKKKFKENELIQTNSYLNPFIIIISPKEIELKGLTKSKTFQYKITLKDVISYFKEKEGQKKPEVSDFIRKLNILFCYYNELGDEFSFINSDNIEVPINIEDEMDITIFVNILLLGRSGTGKSTLINLLLEEMKSIEGGTGFSTTTKNIIVYQKHNLPIRFYDVKGIESAETVENYLRILTDFNMKNTASYDSLNAIFYCIEYKITGTIIQEIEMKVFEKLINFDIPIIFIITKTPYAYDPSKESSNKKIEQERKNERNIIINVIHNSIQKAFEKINKKNGAQEFINNNIKIYFVNLVSIKSKNPPVPLFGIDKVLSYFSQIVPKDNWDELENACVQMDEIKCKELLEKNIFLKYYSDLSNLNLRNQKIAKEYLIQLKVGAFFSGMVPGFDIGMEYYYKYLFKNKLKALYGFDFQEAKSIVIQEEESNAGRNAGAFMRGLGEVGGVVIKALPQVENITVETGVVISRGVVSAGLKAASWILLPITCIGFGTWSFFKVQKDCNNILDIFGKAFYPLRFETLYKYATSFKIAISNLKFISQKLIQDEEEYFKQININMNNINYKNMNNNIEINNMNIFCMMDNNNMNINNNQNMNNNLNMINNINNNNKNNNLNMMKNNINNNLNINGNNLNMKDNNKNLMNNKNMNMMNNNNINMNMNNNMNMINNSNINMINNNNFDMNNIMNIMSMNNNNLNINNSMNAMCNSNMNIMNIMNNYDMDMNNYMNMMNNININMNNNNLDMNNNMNNKMNALNNNNMNIINNINMNNYMNIMNNNNLDMNNKMNMNNNINMMNFNNKIIMNNNNLDMNNYMNMNNSMNMMCNNKMNMNNMKNNINMNNSMNMMRNNNMNINNINMNNHINAMDNNNINNNMSMNMMSHNNINMNMNNNMKNNMNIMNDNKMNNNNNMNMINNNNLNNNMKITNNNNINMNNNMYNNMNIMNNNNMNIINNNYLEMNNFFKNFIELNLVKSVIEPQSEKSSSH